VPTLRDEGYINLAVAQNFLTVDVVQDRLRKAMAGEQPHSTAGYDNMRGSDKLRAAMAVRRGCFAFCQRRQTLPSVFFWHE
jgi:hypothetical protein